MAQCESNDEFIPLSMPHIGKKEWEYVRECLETHWVSYAGSYVERFEANLAQVAGARYCVATNSGTAALHLALVVLGVEPDSEVVMPAISFVAPANAVRYAGAWPTFIDIDERTWQFDLNKLEDFLQNSCRRDVNGRLHNRVTGRHVAALLPVHLLGDMADVDALARLATTFGLPVIEDAAECLGAKYRGRAIGAPAIGCDASRRIVITSFNGNKVITTGGGGALLTHDEPLARRAKHLSTTAKTDTIEFEHDVVGYNYRLSNVLAAIGVGQLELLEQYVHLKCKIAERYDSAFADVPSFEVAPQLDFTRATHWMYTIRVRGSSRELVRMLNEHRIQSRPVWVPLHRLAAFRDACHVHSAQFADTFYKTALSLPCSVTLGKVQQDRVIAFVSAWAAGPTSETDDSFSKRGA